MKNYWTVNLALSEIYKKNIVESVYHALTILCIFNRHQNMAFSWPCEFASSGHYKTHLHLIVNCAYFSISMLALIAK